MIRCLIIVTCFVLQQNIYAADFDYAQPKDSIGYIYEHSLRYEGSDFTVDLNYQYILEGLAELIIGDTSLHLQVRGHVCCGPSYKLSKKRAKWVYKYLRDLGVPKERMCFKGMSDTAPLVFPEKTEEDEAKNRRVDFVVFKYEY